MAEPREITESIPQLKVESIEPTGFVVPPGWYGFVRAAGIGIIRQAGMDRVLGLAALAELGDPDSESRSSDFDGRRLVRVDGGFVVLNYMKYRDRDTTTAERSRRWRQRQKEIREQHSDSVAPHRVATANDTRRHQAEAEAEAEADKDSKGFKVVKNTKGKSDRFAPPSFQQVSTYIHERKSSIDAEAFVNFYESKGWRVGNQPMKNWQAAVRTWEKREATEKPGSGKGILSVDGAAIKRQAAQRLGEKK